MPQETTYAPRYISPDWIVRGENQTLAFPCYRDGQLSVPTAGTVSLIDNSGDPLVDEQAITVVNGIATYALTAIVLPVTTALSTSWHEVWALTMPDGQDYSFYREAHIVRRRMYPVVSQEDLTRLHTEIRRWLAEDQTSVQGYIDAAWDDILLRLMEDGRHPYLVLSPHTTRPVHLNLSLSYLFRDYASSVHTEGKYDELADHYMKEYEKAWDRMTLTYDYDSNDLPSDDKKGQAASPQIFLAEPSGWGRYN